MIGCVPEDRPERIARCLFASRSATRPDVSQFYILKLFFKNKRIKIYWISEVYPFTQNSNSASASDRQEGRTRQKGTGEEGEALTRRVQRWGHTRIYFQPRCLKDPWDFGPGIAPKIPPHCMLNIYFIDINSTVFSILTIRQTRRSRTTFAAENRIINYIDKLWESAREGRATARAQLKSQQYNVVIKPLGMIRVIV